ncbi:argonaute 5, partial [Coemansia furcata]
VRDRELIEIQRACALIEQGYRPEITFLAVLKRHNTRFFPMGRDGDRTGNCVPGTVVDRSVTMPGITDFYLFAHAAIQGTSRPTHYYVLHDDAKFSADVIQQLTYHLCYTYAICTRSVSLVPPVYYAHRVADRARCHLVDMGVGFEEATSSASGHYGGPGTSIGGRPAAAPGSVTAKIIKINNHLDESMYFM